MGFCSFAEAKDEALDKMAANDARLIDCDWNMPKMKGIEAFKWPRAQSGNEAAPFNMLTGEALKENIPEAEKQGVTRLVIKPFTPDTVTQKAPGFGRPTALRG